jgi:hypothetical protein
LGGSLVASSHVLAEPTVEPIQVLGTVEVFSPAAALDMFFDDPERDADFEVLFEEPGADFISCTRVPAGDFLCLDRNDKTLKRFPGETTTLGDVFSCTDDALDLNIRKTTTCTSHTFGLDAHFLAGQNNGKTFSLQRIFEGVGCPNPLDPDASPGLCAEEIYTGRPLLLDIKVIQDEVAENFPYGAGVIGIEQRSDTAFFQYPATAEPILVASKKDWGLKGKQTLLGVDVLQVSNPVTEGIDNYAVVTTSDHTVLAMKIGVGAGPIIVFDINTVPKPPVQCNFDDQHYGLKVDEKSDFAVITDRNWCQAFALQAELDEFGDLTGFELVTETDTVSLTEVPLILSTGAYDPVGPTTSPGKGFDLDDCETEGGCTFISGAQGGAAASLQDVVVVSEESGVTVFQAKGLPFCPYKPFACLAILEPEVIPPATREAALDRLTDDLGVLYRLPGTSPGNQYRPEVFIFNTTPLLPKEITDRFDESGAPPDGLPPLWMLPDFRAQIKNDFFFEALFFVTEARTDDVLTMIVNVAELQGYPELGCETANDLLVDGYDVDTDGVGRLLLWDVVTRASERDPAIDGPQSSPDPNYQGTISNAGCGSVRLRGGGISMFPYNLEASGCPGTLNINGDLVFDTGATCVVDDLDLTSEVADDAVFAKAYVRYYDELRAHLQQWVCPVLTPDDCAALDNSWLNGEDKLVKALDATIDPKVSAGAQNFGAVQAQLNNYQAALVQAEFSAGPDPVNRLGEHAARLETLQHILNDKVAPSVPEAGFVESDRTWAD